MRSSSCLLWWLPTFSLQLQLATYMSEVAQVFTSGRGKKSNNKSYHLLTVYYTPDSQLRALHRLLHWILKTNLLGSTVSILEKSSRPDRLMTRLRSQSRWVPALECQHSISGLSQSLCFHHHSFFQQPFIKGLLHVAQYSNCRWHSNE